MKSSLLLTPFQLHWYCFCHFMEISVKKTHPVCRLSKVAQVLNNCLQKFDSCLWLLPEKKDSLTSSTWFIHVESMYFVAKSAHYETVSSHGKRLDLAGRNGNVFDLHTTTSSFEFSQFDQSNRWCCKIKNWFCRLSESLRILFRESWEEGETFKLTILQYAFFSDVTHCIETIGGQK